MRYDFDHLDDYLDDNVVIPEEIMRMTPEEVENEIARIKMQELKAEKQIGEKKAV